jgi:methylated-DNA-protein-cysteine methyltransferase related protein
MGRKVDDLAVREALYNVVRDIPPGKVMTYKSAGEACTPYLTARQVGQLMACCDPDLPWWRIVGSGGSFPVSKRDPRLGQIQKEMLIQEGALSGAKLLPDAWSH